MATTPPPGNPSFLRTPPTPMHGAKYDSYEPYSPRRSSRISARSAPATADSVAKDRIDHTRALIDRIPDRKPLARQTSNQTLSPPLSPSSPGRRTLSPSRALFANGMLPTPLKTPRKRDATKVGSTARILFAHHPTDAAEMMPTPRRSRTTKRFTLDDEAEDNQKIQVYTDSVDQVPQVDEDVDNPFVVRKSPRKSKISSFTQRLSDVTSGKTKYGMTREIDEAVDNDEGMVYVFRGRKMFRKFDDVNESRALSDTSDAEPIAEDDAVHRAGASARQRITRSSVKPRLLFPPKEPSPGVDDVDEEALTDIEAHHEAEHMMESEDELADETNMEPVAATPKKQQAKPYRPATPPTTVRKTRHGQQALTPEPSPKQHDVVGQGVRLFDTWQRTKLGAGRGGSMKRLADDMVGGSPKRARSSPSAL